MAVERSDLQPMILSIDEGVHYEIVASGCWEWKGYRDRAGYGLLHVKAAGDTRAHRLSWRFHVGPIPEGLVIDHLCRNTCCVNPAHLEPVTHGENIRRGARSVLDMDLARAIRREVVEVGTGTQEIADRYGLSELAIRQVLDGKTWREEGEEWGENPVRPVRRCRLCDEPITTGKRHKQFCCPAHRLKWNSKRTSRRAAGLPLDDPRDLRAHSRRSKP